jgi:glutamate carboxypeptidase
MHKSLADAVRAAFEGEQVPFLARLVDAPSHTYAKHDVEAAALILDEAAAALGLVTTRVPCPEGRFADHRVYATPATGESDVALALVGHVDTVFPRSLDFLRFSREGDLVFGPGSLDMKSGLSEVLFALAALKTAAPAAFARLKARFVCVSDEEVGSPSSALAVYAGLAPRCSSALVFEAGREGDLVVTARKGSALFTVTAHGKAAHAGNKHAEGINAVHALALLVPRIEGLTDYERGITANVGLFSGGTAKNTVPERAECVVDVRFLKSADVPYIKEFFRDLASEPFAKAGGAVVPERLLQATFEVAGGVSRPPMEATSQTQALRERYERHAAAAGLQGGEASLQGGGSDANLLAAQGVPCIDGLGPYGKHFHQVQEYSSLSSLERRTQALAAFLLEEAGG